MFSNRQLLRRQLLTWLLVPLFLLLSTDTFISYWVAVSFSQRAHDRTLVEIAREVSLYLRRANGGALALQMPAEARRLLLNDPVDRVYFQVAAPDGRAVAGSSLPAPDRKPTPSAREVIYDARANGDPVRIVELTLDADAISGRPAAVVRVAETMDKRNNLAREILLSVVIPQLLLILIAGIVVWIGVVRGLAPLQRLQRSLASRSHLDCSPVSEEGVPGEVRPVVHSFNELLARLNRVLTHQSRFISDAAHQLKTPIAALSTQYQVAMRERDPERMRLAIERLSPMLERLSRLVSQLLSLARNEPEAVPTVAMDWLDLNALALEAATDWVPEARKRRIDLGFEAAAAPVMVRGDAGRLRELLDNLLDNAIRYTAEGQNVTVQVTGGAAPGVAINDDGPSIPPHERERVFERFHRLLGSSQDGSGLGLAIAQEIARLHGARIDLSEDTDGIGNTFAVSFPPQLPG